MMKKKNFFSSGKRLMRSVLFALVGCFCTYAASAQNYIPQIGDKIKTDDGVFIVRGANLISNPSFDEGLTDWTDGKGNPLSETNFAIVPGEGPDGTACLSALSGAGSNSEKSMKTGWAITEGKTYLFSCWAKRTASGMSSNTQYSKICQGNSATDAGTQITLVNYKADTWVQTQAVFTAEKPYCVAQFGWLNSATSLDCFFLGEVELSSELSTDKLEGAIADAELLLTSTEEGSERGQYTAEVRKALQDAIDAARNMLSTASTQQEVNDAYAELTAAQSLYRDSANPPFTVGVKYSLIHNSGRYLTTGGDNGYVKIFDADDESLAQVFTLVPAPEGAVAKGYNLKAEDGTYIYREGSWDTKSSSTVDLTTANAIFQVVDYGTFIQLKNMGSGSVLGTDATSSGAGVYSNKNGTGSNNCWNIKKFVPVSERDDQYYFEETLENALNKYDGINSALCGVKAFMISAEAYKAFGDAIAASQEMTDYAAAKALLLDAMAAFDANKINPPVEGVEYHIIHVSNNTLHQGEGSTQPTLATTDETTEQKFSFVPSDIAGAYYIKNLATDSYLAKSTSSAWDTQWVSEASSDEAKWIISVYGEKMYTIQNVAGKGCLGCDATNDGSTIYCDKAASVNNSHWNVTDGSEDIPLEREAFEAALEQAKAVKGEMVEGYHPGEYFASDITAFAAVIAKAETDAKKAVDQETLDAVTAQLIIDTETYKGRAHEESVAPEYLQNLIAECKSEYDAAVVGIEKGQYTEAVKAAYSKAIEAAEAATDAEAAIVALTEARDTFRNSAITVERAAFKALIATAEGTLSTAVVGDCNGQYPAEAVDTYREAVAAAKTIYNNVETSQEGIDAALAELDAANKTFAAQKVTIDFSLLKSVIADANDAMKKAEPEKGDGPGKYPVAAFDKLAAAVNEAQSVVGSNTHNQNAVDDMADKLTLAVEEFNESRVDNDYSELQALVDYADQLLAGAVIGTEEGNYTQEDFDYLSASVAKCEGALSSTLQDEIDKAVKILKRDIDIFKGSVITSINAVFAKSGLTVSGGRLSMKNLPADAVVCVYTVGGQLVASAVGENVDLSLDNGIYIVRLTTNGTSVAKRIVVK